MITKDRPSNHARNVTANWIAFLFVAVVSFFLSPFVVHHLGNTGYGVWALLSALAGYLGLLDFGVRGAVTRYVAHHHAVNDSENCSSIVSAGLAMSGLLGSLAILIAGIVAYFIPVLFTIPEEYLDATRIVLVISGITVAVTMLGAVFGGVIAGLERFDITSGIEIAVTTVRTAVVVAALLQGYGLVTLAVIYLAGSLLNGMLAWMITRRLYPHLRLRVRAPLLESMGTILPFSVYLSAIHICGALIYYSGILVISVFLPVSLVTFYAIAVNLSEYARNVASSLSVLMTPRISALASSGSKRVGHEVVGVARVATLVTAPIAYIFWMRGESFIDLWMGPEYGPTSGEVLRVLAFVVLLSGARLVATASVIGMNKHRALVPAFVLEAVFNLALSVALVRSLGLPGVAIGALIPSLVLTLVYFPRCISHLTGVPVGLFYRDVWLLPMLACAPFALLNVLLEYLLPAGNLAIFFMQVLLTLPLVAVGAIGLCAAPDEKERINAAIRNVAAVARRSIERR